MNFLSAFGLTRQNEEYQKDTSGQQQVTTTDNRPTTSSTNHSYFEKKGEVNELKKIFKDLMEKAPVSNQELQDALKKLIGIMTLGIDLSNIFTDVLMFSYTNDIISKKMIYLYLINYAKTNNETAIMAINTFLKDCNHQDGRIRGNALKTLCSLQTENSLEYMKQQVLRLIDDRDSYVRKIAVMGCLRLYYQDYDFFKEKELIDKLYNLLKDPHKQVVVCAIDVLNEIMISEGGMAINSKIILYLMNRFDDFDCYGKQTILMLLVKYTPQSQQELFDLMNLLEDNLKKNHKPLCLAIINCFVQFTKDLPDIFKQVKSHLSPKLLMLLCSSQDEELYNVLKHVLLFSRSSSKEFFQHHFKMFYIKANEKSYNQRVKLEILVQLANKSNVEEIIDELCEYTGENDENLSHFSIKSLGEIAKSFPNQVQKILKMLLVYLKFGDKKITQCILEVLSDMFKYIKQIPSELTDVFQNFLTEQISKEIAISVLTILSQSPNSFESAPYLAEYILQQMIAQKIKVDRELMNTFLISIIRIFLEKPGETLPILSQFYKLLYSENQSFMYDIDLIERASYYYNNLKSNPENLKKSLSWQPSKIHKINDDELFNQQLNNFGMNDLRILYQKPASSFIKSIEFFQQQKIVQKETNQDESEADDEEDESEEYESIEEASEDEQYDLLNMDDMKGSSEAIESMDQSDLTAKEFQEYWMGFQKISDQNFQLKIIDQDFEKIESKFKEININSIAHSKEENKIKMYLYGKKYDQFVLMEINFDFEEMSASVMMKMKESSQEMIQMVNSFMRGKDMII